MIHTKQRIFQITLSALFTVLIIVCTQIQIPFTIPFTMQTFAIALSCMVIGPKMALVSVITYILLGCVGFPVFSGFSGTAGVLFGATGGYIFGFVIMIVCYMIINKIFTQFCKNHQVFCLFICLCTCYIFGAVWYVRFAFESLTLENTLSVLNVCVLPFIIPDIIKLYIAKKISKSLIPLIDKVKYI